VVWYSSVFRAPGFDSKKLTMPGDFDCLFEWISAGVKQAAWLP
jgi:hypothetical protein